jgi:parallel beta-helix repeat protein
MKKTSIIKKLFFSIFFIAVLAMPILLKPVNSQDVLQTIFIRSDGTVSPETPLIQRSGNVYTFTGEINAAIKILKSDIVIDGAGYTLRGPYDGTQKGIWDVGSGPDQMPENAEYIYTLGIDIGDKNVEGVLIKNVNVKNFSIGMYVWTKNNTVMDNSVSECIVGIMISGSDCTVTRNYIANNKQGLFFGFNGDPNEIPTDIIISENGFVDNIMQLNGCLCDEYPEDEEPHAWDNGGRGNYWSDYNGTDNNNDGIGDTPYVIDVQNHDRYPLMQNHVEPPVPTPKFPIEIIVIAVAVPIIVAIAFLVLKRKKS